MGSLEIKVISLRSLPLAALLICAGVSAQAAVQIDINKDTQTMTVAVDGVARYRWPVSSGLPAHETPNGSFKAFRMEEDHYSKEWDDAPMPHSIFFTKRGHAIHGTDSVNRLGNPASHGCVRLSRANASALFALVKAEGVLNTTVTLSGSSQVALARGPQRRNDVAVRSATPQTAEPQAQIYDGTARTLPPPRELVPQYDTRDGYARYPDDADSSGMGGRTVQPRGYPSAETRRSYEADSYYAQQAPPQAVNPYAPPVYGRQPYAGQQMYRDPYSGQPRYVRPRVEYYYGN